MGQMEPQETLADLDGQASKGSEGNQALLASGQASKASKEIRGTPGPPENLARWASRGPAVPQGYLGPQD